MCVYILLRYGDITAHSASERVVAVVMMVMGCVYFAWITGNIASILGKKDSSIQRCLAKSHTYMHTRVHIATPLCVVLLSLTRTCAHCLSDLFRHAFSRPAAQTSRTCTHTVFNTMRQAGHTHTQRTRHTHTFTTRSHHPKYTRACARAYTQLYNTLPPSLLQ